MNPRIRIAVVDDHPLYREGVTRSLAESGGFEIVGEGSSAQDAFSLAQTLSPDILLLDISMPGGGFEALSEILKAFPNQKIVMLTVAEANESITKALSAGARGYVLKGVGSKSLAEILRAVASGETYLSPVLSARLLSNLNNPRAKAEQPDNLASLTEREREILDCVSQGLSNKRIALKLELQEKTVKHHMTRIMSKLRVTNRTEAAIAFRDGQKA